MRKYFLFITVGVVLFLTTFTAAAVAVALPDIRADFDASILMVGWVISGYWLMLTISVALGGRLSDAFGQRMLFMSCLTIFTAGTALCLVAPNMEFLLAFRFIQGLGGGALTSIAVGIVAQEFAESRQRAIGLLMGVYPLGAIAGPNIGGWIISDWGWKSVFWAILPLLAVALVITALTLRPGKRKESYLDLPGAFMLAAFLSAVTVSLSLIKGSGTPWITVSALLITGIAIIVLFLRREGRIPQPIINLEFLKGRAFAASNSFNFLLGSSTVAGGSYVPMYAVAVYNETTLKSGVIMTPRSIGMLLVSSLIAMYIFRTGYRRPLIAGTLLVGLSHVLLAIQPHHISILGFELNDGDFLFIFMAMSGFGLGACTAIINNICVDLAPDRAATATGIRSMFLNTGGTVSSVIVALVLSNNSTDLPHGFFLIYIGIAVVNLISIPLLFAMPGRPVRSPPAPETPAGANPTKT
ncbi:MFS transporter [Chloroflexota bacterium]